MGVAAEEHVDLRASGAVLVARGPGCLRPWESGVPVTLGSGTYPGAILSGGRAAEDGRTRASGFDEAARTLGYPGPRIVSIRGQGLSGFLLWVAAFGRDGKC